MMRQLAGPSPMGALLKGLLMAAAVLVGTLAASEALAFKLKVVDQNGNPVRGFRWLVEEDTTADITPGVYQPPSQTVRLSVYRTGSPVAKAGHTAGASANISVPRGKRYFVSVLPDGGYSMAGTSVRVPGTNRVTLTVQKHPLPTGQISVKVFHDIRPINNAPDAQEAGIQGFHIQVYDQLGQMYFDAFGNPLGTTYQRDPVTGEYLLDGDGNPLVDEVGNGIYTDANGEALIKFLPPGKYGIRAVPRPTTVMVDGLPVDFPDPNVWSQTATIEGTPGIDAWIRSDEPPALVEFGLAFYHVFIGFVHQPFDVLSSIPNPGGTTGTVSGTIRNVHQSRPPAAKLNVGPPVPEAWVGLNLMEGGLAGKGVYAAPANPETGEFSIAGVPPGTYQLVVWDTPLDQIFGFQTVIVPDTGGAVDMGDVLVNAWFGRLVGKVFDDPNENGFPDPGEVGVEGQLVNLRFRDGRMYQSTTTGTDGTYQLRQVFPWFRWIVAEIDFSRYKATGLTVVVDDGGEIPPDSGWDMPSEGVRNPQPQASINPNTGNNLSRTTVGEVITQALILYADQNHRMDWGKRDYVGEENGGIAGIVFYDTTRAFDDPREDKGEPWEAGIPDVRVNLYRVDSIGPDGTPTALTLVNTTLTDSWDRNIPEGCLHPSPPQDLFGGAIDPCAEFLRTWNQVRPGLYDGAYAFAEFYPGGIRKDARGNPILDSEGNPVPVVAGESPIPLTTGQWVVEVVPPEGYEVTKEEDKNIDFGDRYKPSTKALLPPCVGPLHRVPAELSLFPGVPVRADLANTDRPLCNRKLLDVVPGRNTPADFFLFTYVPRAAKFHGMITNDLTNTFNPNDPNFAEKLSPAWIPVVIRDWAGRFLTKTYSDQWGGYHVMVHSTYTINPPIPTGVSPSMVQVCLNDPGDDLTRPDPFVNPAYGKVCYTFDAWPGSTTNLDTPLLPTGAFTGAFQNRLDCELPNGTPRIKQVTGGAFAAGPGATITIDAVGPVTVQNPDYNPSLLPGPSNPPTILRDYGFGTSRGTITLGGVPLQVMKWNKKRIKAKIPSTGVGLGPGQLSITRGDNGLSTQLGVTLTLGLQPGQAVRRVPADYGTIQAAVDAANPGDLVLVSPGLYTENVIMWKPVALQGSGEGSTVINGLQFMPDNEPAWLAKMDQLVTAGNVSLVPGQRADFLVDRGAGITVLGKNDGSFLGGRIDGFTITQSLVGGAIFVSGYTNGLQISNNRIVTNSGNLAGGIRVGWLSTVDPSTGDYADASNTNLTIRNNHLNQNGSVNGGGGIALFTGSGNYTVEENFICGNFSGLEGGGVAHVGLSPDGRIERNTIIFNEVSTGDKPIRGTVGGQGGGILVAGEDPVAGNLLSPGAGSVTINRNLIQGNAASHDGAGIALAQVNGQDVAASPADPAAWYAVNLFNNIIVNNVAQLAGGGVSLADALRVRMINNTIAHNDSTATNRAAFLDPANPNLTTPQIAGVASRPNSAALAGVLGAQGFSDPLFHDSILFENRSFYWDGSANGGLGALLPDPGSPVYSDLGVVGGGGTLTCTNCLLTGGSPSFAEPYFNVLFAAGAGGEGGNFVSVVFRPLKQTGDYHVTAHNGVGRAAFAPPDFPELATDFDGQSRPRTAPLDAGADQLVP
jgi:hypothetical protein